MWWEINVTNKCEEVLKMKGGQISIQTESKECTKAILAIWWAAKLAVHLICLTSDSAIIAKWVLVSSMRAAAGTWSYLVQFRHNHQEITL